MVHRALSTTKVRVGVDYFLSKRTDMYVIGVYQHALGDTLNRQRARTVDATAGINGLTGSSNQNHRRLASVSATSSNKS